MSLLLEEPLWWVDRYILKVRNQGSSSLGWLRLRLYFFKDLAKSKTQQQSPDDMYSSNSASLSSSSSASPDGVPIFGIFHFMHIYGMFFVWSLFKIKEKNIFAYLF